MKEKVIDGQRPDASQVGYGTGVFPWGRADYSPGFLYAGIDG